MSRYFVRSRSFKPRLFDIDDDAPLLPTITVDDHEAVETGIVAESGDPIMRAPNPMGFGRGEEW